MLQKLDCDEIQGYFFSKPIDVKEYTELLKVGKWIPKNKEALLPQVNRRSYFRIDLEIPLVGDMTITKFGNKKVNIGNTEVEINNIGPGGLSFHSSLKMPVEKDITLRFATEIFSNILNLNGHIIWSKELNNDEYQYGIEFIIEEKERENLVKILNHLQLSLKQNSILPNCRFLLN